MTDKAAYIVGQAACAQIEALAMQEQNAQDREAGRMITYTHWDFMNLMNTYCISHNAVLTYLGEH